MTLIERVRLLIGDRPPAPEVFSDPDLQSFLDDNDDSVKLAAASALEAWAAMYMMNPSSESIGGGDYSYSQKTVDNMLALAKNLREIEAQLADIPALEWAEMDLTYGSGITVEED